MKKSIVIRIPEPCHEDWAKMTATEKGKFCSVCTKEVFDLTSKTDEELVKILTKSKNACGRVKKSQLNREVKLERKSGQSFAPFAASMLLPLTLFSNNPKSESNSISEKPLVSLGIGRFSNSSERIQIVTQGVVRDESGHPLKNVEIISNETKKREWTNKNGEYHIVTLDNEILTFKIKDHDSKEIKLSNSSKTIDIQLNSQITLENITVGRMVYVPEKEVKNESLAIITKGTVTEDDGLPIPGVSVTIKGTLMGTQTDFDGNYTIETKPNDILVFSYVGFETKEITVSNISNSINVELSGMLMGDLVTVVAGGISYEDYQSPKDEAWKEKVKQASENTRAFEKMKWKQKKAERKAKRGNK